MAFITDINQAIVYVGDKVTEDQTYFLEAYTDVEELLEDVNKDFPNGGVKVLSYDGFPDEFFTSGMEIEELEKVFNYFNVIDDLSDEEKEAFTVFIDAYGYSYKDDDLHIIKEEFKDTYIGYFFDEKQFADYYIEDAWEIPDQVLYYIDLQKVWDQLLRFDYTFQDGYVFANF